MKVIENKRTDKDLTTLANENLRNSEFNSRLLGVTAKVSGGSALLVGDVETERDRQLAISEVSKTLGLRNVVSSINLASFKEDTSLTNDINMALMQSKINVNDITAPVVRGKVVLAGDVEKEEDINALTILVQSIPGVENVENKLKVRKKDSGIV